MPGFRCGLWFMLVAAEPAELRSSTRELKGEKLNTSDLRTCGKWSSTYLDWLSLELPIPELARDRRSISDSFSAQEVSLDRSPALPGAE